MVLKNIRTSFFITLLLSFYTITGCETQDDWNTHSPIAVADLPDTTPTSEDEEESDEDETEDEQETQDILDYLALGDSYTIGQSVCNSCNFPAQLAESFKTTTDSVLTFRIIATTGWRTDNLISAIENADLAPNYNLVTLLIGVNNQYQNRNFSQYETEFPTLLQTAIRLAGNDPSNVIVLSIPDYAYTQYGQNRSNPEQISSDLDNYNAFAEKTTLEAGVTFLNITDITRRGLDEPNLVASDGLHPSELAYAEFVERLLPLALEKYGN